jgi:hypothetical protein
VLLVHGLLLLAWFASVTPRLRSVAVSDVRTPLAVRNVALLPPAPLPAASPSPSPAAQPVARLPPVAAATVALPVVDATSAPTAVPVTAVQPVEPAASEPLKLALPTSPRGSSMTGRGALTEAQGSARQLALNDPRSNQKADPTQQLPDAVASAGKGDCMKGEFMGGGMGLLSAPFLALAAATGHCQPLR